MNKFYLILLSIALYCMTAQAALMFNLDSFNKTTGETVLSINGTVDVLYGPAWSQYKIYIGQAGLDWIDHDDAVEMVQEDFDFASDTHNTPISPIVLVSDYSTLNGDDSFYFRFTDAFELGDEINFTWTGIVDADNVDFTLLTDDVRVVIGIGGDAFSVPIPEPASATLFGLVCLAGFGIRKLMII